LTFLSKIKVERKNIGPINSKLKTNKATAEFSKSSKKSKKESSRNSQGGFQIGAVPVPSELTSNR